MKKYDLSRGYPDITLKPDKIYYFLYLIFYKSEVDENNHLIPPPRVKNLLDDLPTLLPPISFIKIVGYKHVDIPRTVFTLRDHIQSNLVISFIYTGNAPVAPTAKLVGTTLSNGIMRVLRGVRDTYEIRGFPGTFVVGDIINNIDSEINKLGGGQPPKWLEPGTPSPDPFAGIRTFINNIIEKPHEVAMAIAIGAAIGVIFGIMHGR